MCPYIRRSNLYLKLLCLLWLIFKKYYFRALGPFPLAELKLEGFVFFGEPCFLPFELLERSRSSLDLGFGLEERAAFFLSTDVASKTDFAPRDLGGEEVLVEVLADSDVEEEVAKDAMMSLIS